MCGFVNNHDMEGPSVEGSADGEVPPAVVENQSPLEYGVYEVFDSHDHYSREQTDELDRAFLGGEGVTSDAQPVQTGDVGYCFYSYFIVWTRFCSPQILR